MLLSLFIFLILVVVRGFKEEGYSVKPFQVPKKYEDAGYNGQVVAFMIQDEVAALKTKANSQRRDSLAQGLNVDLRQDLNLEVMGVGLSATSMIYHLRELMGKENFSISGNITDLDDVITLNIRMTNYAPAEFKVPYELGKDREAFEEVIKKAGLYLLRNTDPYRLSIVYRIEGENEKSYEVIRHMIKNRPQDKKWAYHLWGAMKVKEGKKEAGYNYWKKAIDLDPSFIMPMRALAWSLWGDRDYTEALKYFEMGLQTDPKEKSLDTGAAFCYRQFGDLNKAESHFLAHIRKFPDDLYSYGNYAHFLVNYKKDTVAATSLWQQASENIPESGDYFITLAAFHTMREEEEEALKFIEAALDLQPENLSALSQYSRHYFEKKEFAKAEEYTRRSIKVIIKNRYESGMLLGMYNYLAMTEYEQAHYDSALVHANMAIDLNPRIAFPYSTLAETYILMGDIESFYKAIEQAIFRGFEIELFWDDHPYDRIKDKSRLKALVAKYKASSELKG